MTGCCSPGSLWPCKTKQNCTAAGVDNSQYFDTVTTASWQSWQWDAVSSWILGLVLDSRHFLKGLSHSCWTSCPRAIRRWVLPNASECSDLNQIWKQNMFLACFGTVKLAFPSPLWWDFARQVRFVPANTDQNLSNKTSSLPLKSTWKLVDLVHKMLLAWEKNQNLAMTSNLIIKTVFLWLASRTVVGLPSPRLSGGEAFQINSN